MCFKAIKGYIAIYFLKQLEKPTVFSEEEI